MYKQPYAKYPMFDIIDTPFYLVWWMISDNFHKLMCMCEKMASMVCRCSVLKGHDLRLKKGSFWSKCCTRCDLSIVEDPKHIVMQCPYYEENRKEMFHDIRTLGYDEIDGVMGTGDVFSILMGKHPENVPMVIMVKVWIISGKHISKMYDSAIMRDE